MTKPGFKNPIQICACARELKDGLVVDATLSIATLAMRMGNVGITSFGQQPVAKGNIVYEVKPIDPKTILPIPAKAEWWKQIEMKRRLGIVDRVDTILMMVTVLLDP